MSEKNKTWMIITKEKLAEFLDIYAEGMLISEPEISMYFIEADEIKDR
jgi:hypothetical protein